MQLELNYLSKSINNNVNISIYYPNTKQKSVNIVWLFPGLGANKNDLILNRQIQNAMSQYDNYIFIAIDGYRSFYQNMVNGYDYYDLISHEMKEEVINTLGLKVVSEQIIGVSMGGYGAFYHALTQPGRFKQIISIAGSLHIVKRNEIKQKQDDFIGREWRQIFGTNLASKNDLFKYQKEAYPQINKIYCGYDDHLFNHNKEYVKHLEEIGVNVVVNYTEGKHNYDYFIKTIIEAINEIEEK